MGRVTFRSDIPTITRDAAERGTLAVQKTILDIEAGAAMRSRVDTGAMKSGWTAEMDGAHSGHVEDPVEHTVFNEFGTRHMGAQPMLTPAAEEAVPGFDAAVKQLYR